MNESHFLANREEDWKRLVQLCDRADASPTFLETADFQDLIRVFRRVSGDLALARTKSTNYAMIDFLNDIVGRAYGILYRAPRLGFGPAILKGLGIIAATARRRRYFVLVAVVIFSISVALPIVLIPTIPSTREVFIPQSSQKNIQAWVEGLPDRTPIESALMTGLYASNNPMAAIQTSGIAAATFGLGTAYALYQNGIGTGALAYEMMKAHKLGFFVVSILPHGVTELSGFFLASTAGLIMGWALINPGRRRRGAALAIAGKDAIVLSAASIVMMFMAAPIEGFFSFSTRVPIAVKLVVIALEASGWAAFWIGFGRKEDAAITAEDLLN